MSGTGRLITPRLAQRLATVVLWTATAATVGLLLFIVGFVLRRGAGTLSWDFLFSNPRHSGALGGILPTVVSTLYVSGAAVVVAAPLGVAAAIYLAEYTRDSRLTRAIRSGTEALAGIPSIIFGLFGFAFFVTTLRMGWSILSGGLTLGLMILPTVIRTSEEALRAVPSYYRDVAQSLGASKWQSIATVVLPAAAPGVLTGVVLGVGRAVSETAAVIFTAGVALKMPWSPFDSARTMSVHFYTLTMEGISDEMAYGTASVLVISILMINIAAYALMHRLTRQYR